MKSASVTTSARLFIGIAVAIFARGARADLLVGDVDNHQVLHFTDAGALLGVFGQANDGSGLGIPGGIAVDQAGHVSVHSISNHKILRFDGQGNYLGSFDDATGNQRGLQIDSQGNLWLRRYGLGDGDVNGSHIVRFDSVGNVTADFNTRLGGDSAFAIDRSDRFYVPRTGPVLGTALFEDGVYRFTSAGVALGAFGDATQSRSGCTSPDSVAINSGGDVFVLSELAILRYDSAGVFLGSFAQFDVAGYLMIDPADTVYAGNGSGNGVWKFDSRGNSRSQIITAGVGGVPANFRDEGIAYLPAVPEPSSVVLTAIGLLAFPRRRRVGRSAR